MKERPILFNGDMVRAILSGQKTQTRRVVKPQPHANVRVSPFSRSHIEDGHGRELLCPLGLPGDRLWVRETYFAFGRWKIRFSVKKGRDEWHFVDLTSQMGRQYQFEDPTPSNRRVRGDLEPAWWKRPAIFMPRSASRITLENTHVWVEMLQDISEADALAEGVTNSLHLQGGRSANENFAHLWWQIYGDGAWEANPWVWAIAFNRIDQSEQVLEMVRGNA